MNTDKPVKCKLCGNKVPYGEMYEYRGHLSCEECFDDLQEKVNNQRNQIIEEERHKTDRFKGLDLSDSTIGKANKSILKSDIEIASKESKKLSDYESRTFKSRGKGLTGKAQGNVKRCLD